MKRANENNSGQALLIVLLAMTVILTVVLSVVSRSVTDISITGYEEDSQRAFDAAEAGIEDYLLTGFATGAETSIGDATYKVLPGYPLPDDKYSYPSEFFSGESATFWFVEHDPTTGELVCTGDCTRASNFEVCWGKEGTASDQNTTPAIEITIMYDYNEGSGDIGEVVSPGGNDFTYVKVARGAFDPYSLRIPPNNFSSATTGCTLAGEDFAFSTDTISISGGLPDIDIPCSNVAGCLLLLKVRMFYNTAVAHPIAIDVNPGTASLPSQGIEIDSVGEAGDSTRRVNVFQSYPEPPSVFDAAVFGQGDLTK